MLSSNINHSIELINRFLVGVSQHRSLYTTVAKCASALKEKEKVLIHKLSIRMHIPITHFSPNKGPGGT